MAAALRRLSCVPCRQSLVGLCCVLLVAAPTFAASANITDGWGRSVPVGDPPARIVSLSPHLTEALFALGVGDRISATVSFSDYPPEAAAVPRIGDAFALSREGLAAARADLILAWGAALTPARLADLEALGAVVYVSEPRSLAMVAEELDALTRLTGASPTVAADFADRLADRVAAIRNGQTPLRVLPLISVRPPMTLSAEHFVGDILRHCGAVQPVSGRTGPVIRLSEERLLTLEADLVLNLSGEALPARLRLPAGVPVAELDPDLMVRPGPRVIEGTEQLCALLEALR